ncbi:uncharacterized protein LOC119670932 isoform X2 [Teleopsis dalmanni]|uniref:uncharacterized protein LOC119670932 isoform X2 n=1 Tax=Teleopsis dalmanni TaxID=139649 RepID=UPI0018CE27AE|nr:uncharacterized protein LOC119670932 isoform X2 [Teleopsis dalmanni]
MFGFNFWTQFIDIYKSQPALWDVNSDNYNMKQYKISAYNTLLAKLREIDPNADINMVKRKINSFRSCLRRERQKTVSMAKLGKEYVSTWKFYPYFSFINEPDPFDDDKLVNGSNITYSKEEIVISLGNDESSIKENSDSYPFLNITEIKQSDNEEVDESNMVEEVEISYAPHTKRQKIKFENPDDICFKTPTEDSLDEYDESPFQDTNTSSHVKTLSNISAPYRKSTNSSFRDVKSNYNEDEVLACGWMMQYRNLRSEQKIFAKKAIDDILFEAKLETLHRHSVRINEAALCNNCGRVAEQFSMTN